MGSRIRLMSPALMDRVFITRDQSPETIAISNEDSAENLSARRKEAEMDELRQQIPKLLRVELANLTPPQRGEFTAYCHDRCNYSVAEICDLLVGGVPDDSGPLNPKDQALGGDRHHSAIKVSKFRALLKNPCGTSRGECEGIPGCAHQRGEEVWKMIIRSVAHKLGYKEGNRD